MPNNEDPQTPASAPSTSDAFAPSSHRPRVAFVCVHNSCRSQMAEAIARLKYGAVFESFSAGTHPSEAINADAVHHIKQRFGVDMTHTQKPKTLHELPEIDVLITMGCGVACPALPARRVEDWGLGDPSGQGDEAFVACIEAIEHKLAILARELNS